MKSFNINKNIKEAWKLYKVHLSAFLLFTLITLVLSSIGQEDNFILSILIMLVNILISYIWFRSTLNLVEGKGFNPFNKSILPDWKQYWYFISTTILLSIIILLGFVLLIVPGLYLAGRLMFACYISVDEKKNAIDSIRDSWFLTKNNGWRIFWKGFVIGLFIFLGFIALFFGLFITYPVGTILSVMLYKHYSKKEPELLKE